MHGFFLMARQAVVEADQGQGEWDAAVKSVSGLLRIAQRTFPVKDHSVVVHLEEAVAAAKTRDTSRVLVELGLAEIHLP